MANDAAQALQAAGWQDRHSRGVYEFLALATGKGHMEYARWLAKTEGLPAPAGRLPAHQAPMPTAEIDVRDVDREPLAGKAATPEVTAAVSDMQFGEHEFLLAAWDDWRDRLYQRVTALSPRRLTLLVNGDAITGAGVFRGQADVVAISNVLPQVLYACYKIDQLVSPFEEAGLPVRLIIGPGNHDVGQGNTDMVMQLVMLMQLLGRDAMAASRHAKINLAPVEAEPYVLYMTHGFGNSAYYPASYALVRALKDYLVQQSKWAPIEEGTIQRVNTGHTHWLAVGLDLAGVKLDVNGGWTRPNRHGLGGALRPIGGLLYTHAGSEFAAETVRPTDAVVQAASTSPHGWTDVLTDVGRGLRTMTERLMDLGLFQRQGLL